MRIPIYVVCLLLPAMLGAADRGKVSGGLERLLYVTDRSGVSVYDINDSHKLLRKIDVPETGDYKGISASVQLGKLYLTSYLKDELVCIDLATDKIVWRRHYDDGYADSQAITPDGKTLYLPLRDGDSWWVLDAATGDPKAKIPVTHGKEYAADDHPILGVGPHNTWMNRDGTRVYLEVLTDPYVYIADTRTNRVIGKVGPFSKGIRPIRRHRRRTVRIRQCRLAARVRGGRGPHGRSVGRQDAAPRGSENAGVARGADPESARAASRTARRATASTSGRTRKKSGWWMASMGTSTCTTSRPCRRSMWRMCRCSRTRPKSRIRAGFRSAWTANMRIRMAGR